LAESTDNVLAQNVLQDIADEERVHAGEFLRLLRELEPDEERFYQQGAEEVEEEFLGKGDAAEEEGETPAEGQGQGTGGPGKK